jgi:hypothetical protein
MKTITVSDEQYSFLRECVSLLKTQDNRCTRNPIYTIYSTKTIYGIDSQYSSEEVFIWEDTSYTKEELLEFFIDNGYRDDLLKWYAEFIGKNDISLIFEDSISEIRKAFIETESYELEEFLNKYDIIITNTFEEDQQVVGGTCYSFFEQDAFDHIKMNKHNIAGKNVHTYADSLYRTPRMEKLLELLKNLSFENCNDDAYCEDIVHSAESM